MSQSRSRDFIVLSGVVYSVISSEGVTIPFAGFYCSEGTKWEGKVDSGVTIPFAGFYCSEKLVELAEGLLRSQSRSRDFIVLRFTV